jgi:hypothetical protein
VDYVILFAPIQFICFVVYFHLVVTKWVNASFFNDISTQWPLDGFFIYVKIISQHGGHQVNCDGCKLTHS